MRKSRPAAFPYPISEVRVDAACQLGAAKARNEEDSRSDPHNAHINSQAVSLDAVYLTPCIKRIRVPNVVGRLSSGPASSDRSLFVSPCSGSPIHVNSQ